MTYEDWQFVRPRRKPVWVALYIGWDLIRILTGGFLLSVASPLPMSTWHGIILITLTLNIIGMSRSKYPWNP